MPRVIARFRQDWPETRVSLNIRMLPTVEERAAGQQVDFGFAEMPVRRSGFDTEIFSNTPYVAAVPSKHELAIALPEPEDLRRVEVINGAGGRRSWSADDKGRILEETLVPGAAVSEVARRHGLLPQQVFT